MPNVAMESTKKTTETQLQHSCCVSVVASLSI